MTDYKFTDDELIKLLNQCHYTEGIVASVIGRGRGEAITLQRLIDIINRQKAEIERLKEEGNKYPCRVRMNENSIVRTKSLEDYDRLIGDISAEAIKEFWSELKRRSTLDPRMISTISGDNLVKEMTEEIK